MLKHKALYIFLFVAFFMAHVLSAQAPAKWTSAEIQHHIEKLGFLGSVLYVAAHPDDENTRLISYMANHKKAETAYLSLTRGDGGQNLIGTEIRELLGVLRTQELLAARRIDGGVQYFSRANDFGYSKNPEETFDIWNKEEVMHDVILTIRKFQPDIIINRFDHRTPGRTHGHHTASAMLGLEAFNMSGKKEVYPEQLDTYNTFQAERIFFNTSWWFYGSREKFAKADKTNLYSADIGVYYPLKGKSNTEIAAESRSQHKCQGFGSTGSRGEYIEYMEWLDGSRPSSKEDVFAGIETSWNRVDPTGTIKEMVERLTLQFKSTDPSLSTPLLLEIYDKIQHLEESIWKQRKLEEVKDLILACCGIYIDSYTNDISLAPGEKAKVSMEVINRSRENWTLERIQSFPAGIDLSVNQPLENNKGLDFEEELMITNDTDFSSAYWLRKKGTLGMYTVEDKSLIGLPITPDPIRFVFTLKNGEHRLKIDRALVLKKSDPVKGEVYEPFDILAPAYAEVTNETIIFSPGQTQKIRVEVTAGKDSVQGTLIPCFDNKWTIKPEKIAFELDSKNEKKFFDIEVTAPKMQDPSKMSFLLDIDGEKYGDKLVTVAYDHIPTQQVLQSNEINTICIDIKSVGNRVAYIMGAGDKVPEALRAIGYTVDELDEDDIRLETLYQYNAVIVGVRAYNVMDNMKFHHKTLMKYVENGGTVVTQYNTSRRLKSDMLGPYPLKLSRKRVTDEYAPVTILDPKHEIFNYPNKITEKDFEGWVQERGLYFPDEWDAQYTPLLSSADKGEEGLEGGLLVAKYGDGHFVYTGYSFFRELPAGVPGAYRLFANLISYGQVLRP